MSPPVSAPEGMGEPWTGEGCQRSPIGGWLLLLGSIDYRSGVTVKGIESVMESHSQTAPGNAVGTVGNCVNRSPLGASPGALAPVPHWRVLRQPYLPYSIASSQGLRQTIRTVLKRAVLKSLPQSDTIDHLRDNDLKALDSLFVGLEATASINNALRQLAEMYPEPSWDDMDAWGGRLQPLPIWTGDRNHTHPEPSKGLKHPQN